MPAASWLNLNRQHKRIQVLSVRPGLGVHLLLARRGGAYPLDDPFASSSVIS
jgi:hypothetical protein